MINMMPTALIALSPTLALAVNVGVQILVLKAVHGRVLPSMIIGAAGGEIFFLVLTGFNIIGLYDLWGYFLLSQAAYLCAAFCYFAFVNLNATSVRIRILEELRSVGGQVSSDVIMENYGSSVIVRTRLERMVRTGLLKSKNGYYFIGKRYPLMVIRLLDILRTFLLKD